MRAFHLCRAALARMGTSWLVAFPTITLLLLVLTPLMDGWPLALRTFVLVTLMVPIMTVATPRLARLLAGMRSPRDQARTEPGNQA